MQPHRDEYKNRYGLCIIFIQTVPSGITNKASNMQFKIVSALAFTTFVAAANGPTGPTIIPPFPGNPLPTVRESNCGDGQLECCKAAQVPTGSIASGALASLGIATGSVGGLIGLNCNSVTGGSSCSYTPLCCTDNSHGSVAVACNPVALNQ